jgi:hypothetical protein
MAICVVVCVVPFDGIVGKISALQKVPFASVIAKAVATGVAAFAVSSNACILS